MYRDSTYSEGMIIIIVTGLVLLLNRSVLWVSGLFTPLFTQPLPLTNLAECQLAVVSRQLAEGLCDVISWAEWLLSVSPILHIYSNLHQPLLIRILVSRISNGRIDLFHQVSAKASIMKLVSIV